MARPYLPREADRVLVEMLPTFLSHRPSVLDPTAAFVAVDGDGDVPDALQRVVIIALDARTGVTLQRMYLDARARWGGSTEIGRCCTCTPRERSNLGQHPKHVQGRHRSFETVRALVDLYPSEVADRRRTAIAQVG